jgi:hypothetical protein
MLKRVLTVAATVAAVISLAVVANGARAATVKPAAKTQNSLITLYGWVDNSPPGNGTSAGSGHAGGVGTYSNPVTFAASTKELPYNTKIYVPYMKKYFVHQDECVACDGDWKHGKWHNDLWAGGDRNSTREPEKSALINCENSLTRTAQIIINPPANEPVDTTPIFNPSTRACHHAS